MSDLMEAPAEVLDEAAPAAEAAQEENPTPLSFFEEMLKAINDAYREACVPDVDDPDKWAPVPPANSAAWRLGFYLPEREEVAEGFAEQIRWALSSAWHLDEALTATSAELRDARETIEGQLARIRTLEAELEGERSAAATSGVWFGPTRLDEGQVEDLMEAIDSRRVELKKVKKAMEKATLDVSEPNSKLSCLWGLRIMVDPDARDEGKGGTPAPVRNGPDDPAQLTIEDQAREPTPTPTAEDVALVEGADEERLEAEDAADATLIDVAAKVGEEYLAANPDTDVDALAEVLADAVIAHADEIVQAAQPAPGPYYIEEVGKGFWQVRTEKEVRATKSSEAEALAARDRFNAEAPAQVAEPAAPRGQRELQDELLRRVIRLRGGADTRWAQRKTEGITNDQLVTALSDELGTTRERGEFPGLGRYNIASISGRPQVGLVPEGHANINYTGLSLAKRVRELLELPMPGVNGEPPAPPADRYCDDCLTELVDGKCTDASCPSNRGA